MSAQEVPPATNALPPQAILARMLSGYWAAQCIHVAAKLGLADLVKDGAQSVQELARATGTHARSLHRMLRALASVGVFAEEEPGRFGRTPLADCLRSLPGSQRALAIMLGEEHFRAWGDLLYSIQTGKTAFDHIYGRPLFTYLAEHPRSAEIFDDAMTGIHGPETGAMLEAYDFSGVRTLVDVGGGNGSVLTAVLQQYPSMQGILYDRPDVIERARPALESATLDGRCRAMAGDFFHAVPAGGDAYLLRHIIHDWDDEQALTILKTCLQALSARGRLLLVESVIPPGNEPFFGKFLDITMLLMPGGMERTEEEYRVLLQAAGFRLKRIVPTRTEVSVIESEAV